MIGSLRALLAGAIDYAGLFPPARLPLAEAVGKYRAFRRSDQAWMLGHFVLPVAQLGELTPLVDELNGSDEPLSIALVAPAEASVAEWLAAMRRDLVAVRQFNTCQAGRAVVRALELRLPAELSSAVDSGLLAALFNGLSADLTESHSARLSVFLEASLASDWRTNLAAIVRVLAECRRRLSLDIGLKLRTGGLDPADFPTPEQVAAVIQLCRDESLPWKATAGLHHAVRQYRDEVGTEMHGFLNLLVAMVLARAESLGEAEIADILRDGSIRCFACDESHISWNNRRATLHQIRQARQDGMLSFGSCSFDEPREELEQLSQAVHTP